MLRCVLVQFKFFFLDLLLLALLVLAVGMVPNSADGESIKKYPIDEWASGVEKRKADPDFDRLDTVYGAGYRWKPERESG